MSGRPPRSHWTKPAPSINVPQVHKDAAVGCVKGAVVGSMMGSLAGPKGAAVGATAGCLTGAQEVYVHNFLSK